MHGGVMMDEREDGIAAVIFDMDGLLIDSEPLWCRAQVDVLQSINYAYEAADCAQSVGVRIDQAVANWYEQQPWQGASQAEVTERILERMLALIAEEGQPLPGALATVDFFEQRGLPLAVGSSSPQHIIAANINALGLDGRFEVVCSAEDDRYGKPHPAVYLRTADKLDVDRRRCLVFEDSIPGLLAAKAAEMTCICVPDADHVGDKRLGIADWVLPSLSAFGEGLWQQIADIWR